MPPGTSIGASLRRLIADHRERRFLHAKLLRLKSNFPSNLKLGAGCDGRSVSKANGSAAYGEVVWSWRRDAGAKPVGFFRNAFKGSSEPVRADRIELAGQPPKAGGGAAGEPSWQRQARKRLLPGRTSSGSKTANPRAGKMSSGTLLNRSC